MIELTQIGTVLKSHGKQGQLRIYVEDNYLDDLQKARAVFINMDGSKVPFLVENIEFKNHILIKLDELDSPEEASKISLRELYLESSAVSPESQVASQGSDLEKLIGYNVLDQNNEVKGKVIDVVQNEFQDLLEIEYNDSSYLWPIHEDLILAIDHSKSSIQLELHEGFNE